MPPAMRQLNTVSGLSGLQSKEGGVKLGAWRVVIALRLLIKTLLIAFTFTFSFDLLYSTLRRNRHCVAMAFD